MESKIRVSTVCCQCGHYFRIESPAKSGGAGLLARMVGGSKAPAPHASARSPSVPVEVPGFSEEADTIAESKPNDAAKHASLERDYRTVVCFECSHTHRVSFMSTSSMCPKCGFSIDLRGATIRERTTQKILTRGDVHVEEKGALLGTSITCGNLLVEGQVAGSIDASGTVTFRNSGTVLGEVRCTHLIIERNCSMQFLQSIHAETVEIYGEATGHFHLTGRMFLNQRGALHGSLRARSILMEDGAIISGPMEILSSPPSPNGEEPAVTASAPEPEPAPASAFTAESRDPNANPSAAAMEAESPAFGASKNE